jgi:hypothetical protein
MPNYKSGILGCALLQIDVDAACAKLQDAGSRPCVVLAVAKFS